MSNGKKHEKININFLTLGLASALGILIRHWFPLFLMFGYYVGTYFMNNDLDIKSRPYRRWGIFRFIWIPYQKTFKHRSLWTHGYIISDIIRYAYLTAWYIIFVYIIGSLLHYPVKNILFTSNFYLDQYKILFISFIFGNMLSSIAHTVTDKASTTTKIILKTKKQKTFYKLIKKIF